MEKTNTMLMIGVIDEVLTEIRMVQHLSVKCLGKDGRGRLFNALHCKSVRAVRIRCNCACHGRREDEVFLLECKPLLMEEVALRLATALNAVLLISMLHSRNSTASLGCYD